MIGLFGYVYCIVRVFHKHTVLLNDTKFAISF